MIVILIDSSFMTTADSIAVIPSAIISSIEETPFPRPVVNTCRDLWFDERSSPDEVMAALGNVILDSTTIYISIMRPELLTIDGFISKLQRCLETKNRGISPCVFAMNACWCTTADVSPPPNIICQQHGTNQCICGLHWAVFLNKTVAWLSGKVCSLSASPGLCDLLRPGASPVPAFDKVPHAGGPSGFGSFVEWSLQNHDEFDQAMKRMS